MKFNWQQKPGMMFALLLPLIPGACAHLTPTPATDGHAGFCDVAKVITFSRLHDTPETIEQIKEQNAVFAKLCAVP